MSELTYTQVGDYLIQNIALTNQPDKPIGRYGCMRLNYLKEHRPVEYNVMVVRGMLYPHLVEIDEAAERRLELLMPQLAKAAGATEELKARDQMRWVGLMNTCRAQVEEIICDELIYN